MIGFCIQVATIKEIDFVAIGLYFAICSQKSVLYIIAGQREYFDSIQQQFINERTNEPSDIFFPCCLVHTT